MRSTRVSKRGELARVPGFGMTRGLSGPLSPTKGVPEYLIVNGLVYERLTGADGQFLTGSDGRPLYGRTA